MCWRRWRRPVSSNGRWWWARAASRWLNTCGRSHRRHRCLPSMSNEARPTRYSPPGRPCRSSSRAMCWCCLATPP
ncbi:hypothetical protein PputUW4_03141 [Pseudomonas sp. UW4]|nr:hypothetical protein PputUW4_03141 [Pseudomonas sp. UW4]